MSQVRCVFNPESQARRMEYGKLDKWHVAKDTRLP